MSDKKKKMIEIKQDGKESDLTNWVKTLYETKISDEELAIIYESIRYKGFNREQILKAMMAKSKELKDGNKVMIEIILCVAIQGPLKASTTKMSNDRTPIQMGIQASGAKGTEVLTCSRICSASSDLAALYMKRLRVPKKLNIECPSWLQFPSAASIRMPDKYRQMFENFIKKFELRIDKRKINEADRQIIGHDIYEQQIMNSYCDPKIYDYLFEESEE
jgi:hypothetical protein